MDGHVCPVWLGYFLASGLRKVFQRPEKIVGPYVEKGMVVLDVGCAMGFFSLPLARLAGSSGRVVCVDVQLRMLEKLQDRARKAGLAERIEVRQCRSDSLCLEGLEGQVDFALAFAVVHEAPCREKFLNDVTRALKSEGKMLISEPRGHVGRRPFEATVAAAEESGLRVVCRPEVALSRAVLMERGGD